MDVIYEGLGLKAACNILAAVPRLNLTKAKNKMSSYSYIAADW
jgi:hypothetical protein